MPPEEARCLSGQEKLPYGKKLMTNYIFKYYIQLFVHIYEEMGWLVNKKVM